LWFHGPSLRLIRLGLIVEKCAHAAKFLARTRQFREFYDYPIRRSIVKLPKYSRAAGKRTAIGPFERAA